MKEISTMMRAFALIGLLLLAGCRTPEAPLQPLPTIGSDSPELKVMEALLKSWMGRIHRRVMVISDGTMAVSKWQEVARLEGEKGLPAGLAEDFIAKNQTAWRIPQEFTNRVPVLMLPAERLDFLYSPLSGAGPNSLNRFYYRYPNAIGVFEFSRVGFDHTGNVALVTVRSPSSVNTWELRRKGNDWEVKGFGRGPSWIIHPWSAVPSSMVVGWSDVLRGNSPLRPTPSVHEIAAFTRHHP